MKNRASNLFSLTNALSAAALAVAFLLPQFVQAETFTIQIPVMEGNDITFDTPGIVTSFGVTIFGPLSWNEMRSHDESYQNRSDPSLEVTVSAHHNAPPAANHAIRRSALSFDTSAIPNEATITTARLILTPADVRNDYPSTSSFIGLYEGVGFEFRPEHKKIDYGACGDSLDAPTPLAPTVHVISLVADVEYFFELNNAGKLALRKNGITKFCLREGHDVENVPVVEPLPVPWKVSGAYFHSSRATTDVFRPYLEITYDYVPSPITPIPTDPGVVETSIPVSHDSWVSGGGGIQFVGPWQAIRELSEGYATSTGTTLQTTVRIHDSSLDQLGNPVGQFIDFNRTFLTFDTTAIPAGSTILDARLKLSLAEKFTYYPGAGNTVGVYQGNQQEELLQTTDYPLCGDALTDPTLLAPELEIDDAEIDTQEFIFLESGRSVINPGGETNLCLRVGYDAHDIPIYSGSSGWEAVGGSFYSSLALNVDLHPQLEVYYIPPTQHQECCSSVIFLPGFEGSRLQVGANELWPPTPLDVVNDLQKLELDDFGNSKTSGIVTTGILENYLIEPVYADFKTYMDTLVPETIKEWYPLAYDWRFTPDHILENGIETSAGHVDVLSLVEEIALRSDTGQVTLVAHSNGGLLGKTIVKELETQGKENIIDSFVMVGSPQLGTPQAIGGLLHGEGSELGNWLYTSVSQAQARTLGANMESAYNLLPSREFFNRVTDPTVIFDENAGYTDPWRVAWGIAIGNYTELFQFLTDDTRTEPSPDSIDSPITLDPDLVSNADTFHQEFDAYVIPNAIRTVQVAGWGVPTIKRIEYLATELYRPFEPPNERPYYIPRETIEGDGTVVYPSALSSAGEQYYFDRKAHGGDAEHKDLLSLDKIQDVIYSVVTEVPVIQSPSITTIKPNPANAEDRLLAAVHSPLTLSAYDNQNNFTGVDPNNDPNWGIQFVKNEIPDSSYRQYGEAKYLSVPKDGEYVFEFSGTDNGFATIVFETIIEDTPTTSVVFSEVSVTPTTQIELTFDNADSEVFEIKIDTDNDGDIDDILAADGTELSLTSLLELLRIKISALNISSSKKSYLIRRIDSFERSIQYASGYYKTFLVLWLRSDIQNIYYDKNVSYREYAEIARIMNQIEDRLGF